MTCFVTQYDIMDCDETKFRKLVLVRNKNLSFVPLTTSTNTKYCQFCLLPKLKNYRTNYVPVVKSNKNT